MTRLWGTDSRGKVIDAQIATLTAYRKSLIHECVTGQRRVTDSDVGRAGHSETRQLAEERAA